MKRRHESPACGLEQILLFTVLIVAGLLLPTVQSVWGEDETFVPTQTKPHAPLASPAERQAADQDKAVNLNHVRVQSIFLTVPTELVESMIADWTLAPFDEKQIAAAYPFATMNQPLQRSRVKRGGELTGQVAASTQTHIPSTHKILNDAESKKLIAALQVDDRTQLEHGPQMFFIDGLTATAVVGEQTPMVVGWKDDLPQTRFIPHGKMVRLRSVLDGNKMWLDYEITLSRILDVATRSIRVANRPQPIKLAVPDVQTTLAESTVEMPVGGTVLIGGLPAESKDGVPQQLLVLLRADQPLGLQARAVNSAESNPGQSTAQNVTPEELPEPAAAPVQPPASPRRNPFSLISRILQRNSQPAVDPAAAPAPPNAERP